MLDFKHYAFEEEKRWRPIKGWEGLYDVSRYGEVRNARKSNFIFNSYVKPVVGVGGYLHVHLTHAGRSETVRVHRAVAQAFLGDPPDGCSQVNHIDEDKTNNCIDNLEWCTPKHNANHGTAQQRKAASFRRTMAERKSAQHL